MHIFHNWEIESKRNIEISRQRFRSIYKVDGTLIVEKCIVCGKRKAKVTDLNGHTEYVSLDYVDSL